MALTKISTGGVKDDTADEAKLKVSNAGSNGQFLQKQSGDTGGLTWATVNADVVGDTTPQLGGNLDVNGKNIIFDDSSDGAADDVLKFGQGTDLSIYSDGATGVFQGDINFKGAGQNILWDNSDSLLWFKTSSNGGQSAKAHWGDGVSYGNLEISKLTSCAFIGTRHTDLEIHSGDSKDIELWTSKDINFINSTGGTNYYLRCKENSGSDQCVELYYGNTPTKRLETTSTGINVIGQINVDGSPLSTSPTITANADGAIGAGDPVEIQANGTVKKITQTISVLSTPSLTVAKTVPPSEVASGGDASIAYWPDKSSFVFTFKGSSNHRFFNTGKVSGTSFTYGTAAELTTNNNNGTSLTHATGDHFIVNWRKPSGNDVYVENLEVTKTNDTTYSYSLTNATKLFDTAHDLDFAKVDSSGNYFLCVARDSDNSNYGLSRMVYRNSNGAFTAGTEQDTVNTASFAPSSVTATQPFIIWDSNVSRAIVLYNKGGSGDKFVYNIGTPNYSTTNPTMTWLTTTPSVATNSSYDDNPNGITGYFDSTNNRIVVIWEEQENDGTQSNRGKIIVGTVTGGSTNSISWGSVTTFDNYYTNQPQCAFDTTAGVGLVHYSIAAGSEPSHAYRITVDPSDNSVTLSNKLSSGMVTGGGSPNGDRSICFDVANGLFIAQQTDSANNYRNVQYGIAAATSTTTASNYLGLNQAAVTNGNAATIDLIGAVNENQSSLTIGSDYYVQPNGTLGTSAGNPSVYAGKAVAATKLVVKG